MSKLELVRELYGFNEWANGRILEAAAKVSEDDLRSKPLGAYTTIIADLAHVIGAQVTWLGRWQAGKAPDDILRFDAIDSFAEVRAEAEKSHKELREYFARLTDDDVNAEAEYEWWIDPSWPEDKKAEAALIARTQRWARWRMFMHVANHGTYHRGEIALCLTALGESPGELDILHYLRQR